MLRVGMPQWTLRVRFGTQSVPGCIPTRSVGTIIIRHVCNCLTAIASKLAPTGAVQVSSGMGYFRGGCEGQQSGC
jgi:hypothetical protein